MKVDAKQWGQSHEDAEYIPGPTSSYARNHILQYTSKNVRALQRKNAWYENQASGIDIVVVQYFYHVTFYR